ncbi:MAG: nitroreductase family protein [Methanobrevibacter sp.]|jgi:nitroreductase|nr:nitroreductase family protein [Methanobrevibacter sp.]
MEFYDVIRNRYSVRGFKDQEVEKEKLDKVLEAATIAPTGVNFQPFKVFVIDTKKYEKELLEVYNRDWFVQAPYVLCVAADRSKAWNRPWDSKNIADIDATIVMDHIILAATDLGLGTCYIAAFKKYAAVNLLNLSEEYEPILFTPLGYPDAERADRPRKPLDELVVYLD